MKEIVITNKSGITLPTKKSLVDDDIKIKIDKSLVGIDGVSVERGLYGAKDLFINGNELPSDTTGLMIDSYAGGINIYNSTETNDEKINLQLSGYIDVSLNDSHPENIITSENLTPENIKKDVNILGTVGTFEGGTPIELSTSEEMEAVLVADNIGKIYKYVGETNETFTNGNLYQVMEVE